MSSSSSRVNNMSSQRQIKCTGKANTVSTGTFGLSS